MRFINAHIFTSLPEAQAAIDYLNECEGIPFSPDAVTRTYCTAVEYNGGFYIAADEVTTKHLGEPVEIEII